MSINMNFAPDIKFVDPGWVDEAWRYDGALQEMYVSLLGPVAWRSWRVLSLPSSMVLDLYIPQDWDTLVQGFHDTLAAVFATGYFASMNELAIFIINQVGTLNLKHRRTFHAHPILDDGFTDLNQDLGFTEMDDTAKVVLRLAAVMLTCMTNDNDPWFTNNIAAIWFDICDIPLGREPVVDV